MTYYDFRLRFNLSKSYRIKSDAERLEILVLDTGEKIKLLSGVEAGQIKNYDNAAIIGSPFVSEAKARTAAEKSKAALLYWAVEQQVGIDFGDGKIRSFASDACLANLQKQHGCPFRNDLHGIDVYEHVDNIKFVSVSATPTLSKAPHVLIDTFRREYLGARQVEVKLQLACEIYASSFFDISPRSRFITLVTAVEALNKQLIRPDKVLELLTEFETKVDQLSIDCRKKQSIIGGLKRLREQSVREAGRELTSRLIPDDIFIEKSSVNFFGDIYTMRSELLHDGALKDKSIDILNLANETQRFVARLLLAALNSHPYQGSVGMSVSLSF